MSARPALTLLLLTPTRMQRADVAPDGALHAPSEWARERPPGTGLADHAELTLRQGGSPAGKQLWVLASELWTQTAALPSGAARASSPKELQQALALEVEALSGHSSLDAQVALRPLGEADGQTRYWVTLAPDYLLEDLAEVATRNGTKLAGVCHPGGLPRSLSLAGGAWERLELWEEALFDLRHREGSLEVEVEPGGSLGHLPPAEGEAAQEVLVTEGGAFPSGAEDATRLDLEDPEVRQRWLTAWGKVLLHDTSGLPVLQAPRRPLTRSGKLLIGLSLFCATVLACAGHYGWAQRKITRLEARLSAAAAPAQAAAQLDQRLTSLTKERDAARAEAARLTQIETRYRELTRVHRGRHARLLRALAAAPAEVLLESLHDRGRTLTVEGVAADPQVALRLATSLARDLRDTSWRVGAPQVTPDGGAWRFSLELLDQAQRPGPLGGKQ